LTGYDYGSNGIYFVTICTHNRETYFGAVETQHPSGGETQDVASLRPTAIGQVAIDCWYAIPDHFPFVQLDAFQMMPNHLHGVLWICKPDYDDRDGQPNTFGPQRQNLASVIRGYKVGVKKYAMVHGIEFMWQPRYYDRVVRSPNELNRIRTYIDLNPDKWVDDRENLQNLYM
jgi:REP element-mobilizing transposase RayT